MQSPSKSHSPSLRDFPWVEQTDSGSGIKIGTSVIEAPSQSKPGNRWPSERLHCMLKGSTVYMVNSS